MLNAESFEYLNVVIFAAIMIISWAHHKRKHHSYKACIKEEKFELFLNSHFFLLWLKSHKLKLPRYINNIFKSSMRLDGDFKLVGFTLLQITSFLRLWRRMWTFRVNKKKKCQISMEGEILIENGKVGLWGRFIFHSKHYLLLPTTE